VGVGIHQRGPRQFAHVARTARGSARLSRDDQHGKQDRGQNRDDRYHDQKLDQRKACSIATHGDLRLVP